MPPGSSNLAFLWLLIMHLSLFGGLVPRTPTGLQCDSAQNTRQSKIRLFTTLMAIGSLIQLLAERSTTSLMRVRLL